MRGARAELHRAVEEGARRLSEGAVRRALALGVAVDDPAFVSANAALLERRRLAAADEQKRAEELRREIEGRRGRGRRMRTDRGWARTNREGPDGDDEPGITRTRTKKGG